MVDATPAQRQWLVKELLEMTVAMTPVEERHKFLTDLYKQMLN